MSTNSNSINSPKIFTNRFFLRSLKVEDVSDRYLGWLNDSDTSQFIITASKFTSLNNLRQYVIQRVDREDVIFLGIFEKKSGLHIGNIKFEPINSKLRFAIMGILIGDTEWHGKGVAAEVLLASTDWLCRERNIKKIILGVDRLNIKAISAYRKVGFVEQSTNFVPSLSEATITMIWHL